MPKHLGELPYWAIQYQTRYILADNIGQAEKAFADHFADETWWPKGFHEVVSFDVMGCPGAERYVGYDRFEWDVRTEANKEKVKQDLLTQVDSIQDKVQKYLAIIA